MNIPTIIVGKPEPPVKIPQVLLTERVIQEQFEESIAHEPTETGEAMVGLELPDRNMIIILGTIPDFQTTIRNPGGLDIGGRNQQEVYKWLMVHWNRMREKSRANQPDWVPGNIIPFGVVPKEMDKALCYLGDWHKHPGGMNYPSSTDYNTAKDRLSAKDEKRNQVLAPIVTMYGGRVFSHQLVGDHVRLTSDGPVIHVNWYYLNRDIVKKNPSGWQLFNRDGDTSGFAKINPVIVPDAQMPWLAPLPWHLANPELFRLELGKIRQKGYEVHVQTAFLDDKWGNPNIQKVCFIVDHPAWKTQRLLLKTQFDYPYTRSEPHFKLVNKVVPPAPGAGPTAVPAATAKKDNDSWLSKITKWLEEDLFPTNYYHNAGIDWQHEGDPDAAYLVDYVLGIETQKGLKK